MTLDDLYGVTEIYKLFDKQTGQLLGLFRLDTEIKCESFDYKETHNTQAELTIRLEFTPYDDLNTRTYHSYFLACYISKPFVDIEPRASISSHDPFNIGGIELNPSQIRGHRVGSLIMCKIIQWLQQFPLHTQVNPIDFVPSGNAKAVKQFYENAGVPVNGDAFAIADLKLNHSWQQNIHQTCTKDLINEIVKLKQFLAGAEKQLKSLKLQTIEIAKIQYTLNPWVALKSYNITPNMLKPDYTFAVDTSTFSETDQGLIELYITDHFEAEKYKNDIAQQLKNFDDFNHYKQPRYKWRNFCFALTGCIRAYKNVLITLLFIVLGILVFKQN